MREPGPGAPSGGETPGRSPEGVPRLADTCPDAERGRSVRRSEACAGAHPSPLGCRRGGSQSCSFPQTEQQNCSGTRQAARGKAGGEFCVGSHTSAGTGSAERARERRLLLPLPPETRELLWTREAARCPHRRRVYEMTGSSQEWKAGTFPGCERLITSGIT